MHNEKIFGTDGIRRKVSDFSVEFLLHLGQTIGHWLRQDDQDATVLIGRDTRRSGEMIEAALTTGLLSQGVNVSGLGVIPTSGVAYLTKETEAKLGIVLSDSLDEISGLVEQIKKSEATLARSGPQFINVRYSGTEKGLVRVTVKGIVQEEVEEEAANIARVIENWKKS